MNKTFAVTENLRAALFVDSASSALQDIATLEAVPADIRLILRRVDEVLCGAREILADTGRMIAEQMPDDEIPEGIEEL